MSDGAIQRGRLTYSATASVKIAVVRRLRVPVGKAQNLKGAERETETKELDMVRNMAPDADASLAVALSAHGVKKNRARPQRRPRGEVEKVLTKILVSGKEASNPQDVLQTIDEIMARASYGNDNSLCQFQY